MINLQQIKTDLNSSLPREMMVKTKGTANVGKKNNGGMFKKSHLIASLVLQNEENDT